MAHIWQHNITANRQLVQANAGPTLVTVVSGSEADQRYWQQHFDQVRRDIFRQDGTTRIVSVCEGTRKGNFLGTLNAWATAKQATDSLPPIALMSMVFGKGKRFSPFTQTMGNRKSAFKTPLYLSHADTYATTADVSNLYANVWLQHLHESGFRGLVVKWGDEAIIPGLDWRTQHHDFSDVDAIRFVWRTEPTETLAREKDWVAIDAQTGMMTFQYSRQERDLLQQRLNDLPGDKIAVGVNLGSLAISYELLDIALDIFGADLDDVDLWNDWDPYTWIALCCRDEAQWQAEIDHEARLGKTGLRDLLARYPDFFEKITYVRTRLEAQRGRPLRIGTLDFGSAFWTDLGLHITLRQRLEAMLADTDEGRATRELFGIPHERDANGSIIVNSEVPAGADIRNSIILSSTVTDAATVMNGVVMVGCRQHRVTAPEGGSALFCVGDHLVFAGAHGIAYRAVGADIEIPAGGRYTTLLLPAGPEAMIANETILDFKGDNYDTPIPGNRLSFAAAGALMEPINGVELDAAWRKMADDWQRRQAARS